jgi:hypothetical protein
LVSEKIAESLATANPDAHIFAAYCNAIYSSNKLQVTVADFVPRDNNVVAGHFVRQRIGNWEEVFV